MTRFQPISPSPLPSRIAALTIELSNARMGSKNRRRNCTETYTIGVADNGFAAAYDLFSFCCYRALLLGSPGVIISATLQRGKRKLLTEPLSPQPLAGEKSVEQRESSGRMALNYRFETRRGRYVNRAFYGYRWTDPRTGRDCLQYQPHEVIRDPGTGWPPTFSSVDDFRRKSQVIAPGGRPLTKTQAWSTWLWLVLHATLYAAKSKDAVPPDSRLFFADAWDEDVALFRGHSLHKKAR